MHFKVAVLPSLFIQQRDCERLSWCYLPYLTSPGCFLHSSALFYSGWDGLSSKSRWSAAALMWSPWWRFVFDPVTTSHGPKRSETVGCAIEVHPGLTSCFWLYPARQTPASLIITGGQHSGWVVSMKDVGGEDFCIACLQVWKHYTCSIVEN